MSAVLESKFHVLASHGGPGGRKGHHVDTGAGRNSSPRRSKSMPGLGIPAGHSVVLGSRLGLDNYTKLNSRYQANLMVPPPRAAPRKKPPERMQQSAQMWEAPERLKPETLPAAGTLVQRVRGKRLVEANINALSNVDTLIWGRDVDGSDGCRAMAHAPVYKGAAGLNAKFERTPAWGELPPTCQRTFGEDAFDPTLGDGGWAAVHYERLDPRKDLAKT